MTTEGQGGSIPLCNVLAETYPDAEIMLLGVEEPRCLIHAPNESVDPSEIEHIALAEALFLSATPTTAQELAHGRSTRTGAVHRRGLRAAHGRARPSRRDAAGLTGVLVTPGPDLRLPRRLRAGRDHRAADAARRPGGPRAGDDRARSSSGPTPRARRARARSRCTDWADGTDPYAAAAELLDASGPLRDLRLGLGAAAARPPAGAARTPTTSR